MRAPDAKARFPVIARTAVGVAQGVTLYLLQLAHSNGIWPATDGLLFAPLLMVVLFAPLVFVAAVGNLRPRTLAVWTATAVLVCAALGFYAIFRDPIADSGRLDDLRLVPPPHLWIALAVGLFIAQSLIVAADLERKRVASYSGYFDIAWKHGVQLVLAVLFLGAFWVLLWLGAALFALIGITAFAALLPRPWFFMPATTLVLALALHITDVRAAIVRGVRTLMLALLSWLLPLMAAIVAVFLLALPFTGLQPLWSTRSATATLLVVCVALVLLINAAFQDGRHDEDVRPVLRYSRLVAAILLTPLVVLAGYALLLRVGQYGWTPQRIVAGAAIVVVASYALGYLVAAAARGVSLRWLPHTNVVTAYVILAVLIALFSPIADPARLSVADQIARLNSGQADAETFDYAFLRLSAGRYGRAALKDLAARTEGPQAATIAAHAEAAIALEDRWENRRRTTVKNVTPDIRAANITVIHPIGGEIPAAFVNRDWNSIAKPYRLPRCLVDDAKCEAILADLDDDGVAEILLFNAPRGGGSAFKAEADGNWELLGPIENANCGRAREALIAGQFTVVVPPFKEIEAGGQRLRVARGCAPQPVVPSASDQ